MNLRKSTVRRLISSLTVSAMMFVPLPLLAQNTQYAQGLILDYYIIQNPEDVEGPKGRSMATLLDTSVPQMSYLGPFEIEPALEQFRDKLWGLHWTGFLKVEDAGPHSFNLLINTSAESNSNVYASSCQSWLKVQDRVISAHDLKWFRDGNRNSYGDINLRTGIYAVEVWFACNDFGNRTNPNIAKPSITVNMRGPNDAMLIPIPRNQLLHEM